MTPRRTGSTQRKTPTGENPAAARARLDQALREAADDVRMGRLVSAAESRVGAERRRAGLLAAAKGGRLKP